MAKKAKKVSPPKSVELNQPEVLEGPARSECPHGFVPHASQPGRFIRIGKGR